MAQYLDEIIAYHRTRASGDRVLLPELEQKALATLEADPPRDFEAALRGPEISLIAEIKRRSPSKGEIAPDLDPKAVAVSYEEGGAACLSVLTDEPHFGGSTADLVAARAAVGLPVLRKDFTVSVADVFRARLMGADAVLLIAAVLTDSELEELHRAATGVRMCPLVEVHDSEEAARAATLGAKVVGINQRDLRTFKVDRSRAASLAAELGPGVTKVAESGIAEPSEVSHLHSAGFDAVLVGESLLRSPDPASAVRRLLDRTRAGTCG